MLLQVIYGNLESFFLYTLNCLLRKQTTKRKMRRIKESLNPTLAMELTFQIIDGHRLFQNWM